MYEHNELGSDHLMLIATIKFYGMAKKTVRVTISLCNAYITIYCKLNIFNLAEQFKQCCVKLVSNGFLIHEKA